MSELEVFGEGTDFEVKLSLPHRTNACTDKSEMPGWTIKLMALGHMRVQVFTKSKTARSALESEQSRRGIFNRGCGS